MPCYNPINGFRSRTTNLSGKRNIVFTQTQGFKDMPVTVPCGQCIGCRLERSRQWAIRCVHEAQLHDQNSFLTLTYAPEHLPKDQSLVKSHMQKFFKRLRKKLYPQKFRYFYCGEYGEKNDRPHYHVCLFGYDFPDKKHFKTINGNQLYTSEILESTWGYGLTSVGNLTFESAAYVARYITKKITGKYALHFYNRIDSKGEIISERLPEFNDMSRKPGIAKAWFQKFSKDVFPSDFIILREKKMKPPKYYDKLFDQVAPADALRTKQKRKALAKQHESNNTYERLLVREEHQQLKLRKLKRSYETNET